MILLIDCESFDPDPKGRVSENRVHFSVRRATPKPAKA